MIYAPFPGVPEEMMDELELHADGCLTINVLNNSTLICFESESTFEDLKDILVPEIGMSILLKVDPKRLYIGCKDEEVIFSIRHPFDPNSKCKKSRNCEKSSKLDVNEILEKIHSGGWSAITDEEREFLNKKSK